jgi:hypothetical protein
MLFENAHNVRGAPRKPDIHAIEIIALAKKAR